MVGVTMGFEPADQEIVRLLAKLKRTGGTYPEPMLVARRQSYQKRMVEIGLGIGIGAGLENAAKHGGASHAAAASSKILETAILVAIAVETGTVGYLYRDQLADFFRSLRSEPRVEVVTPAPVIPTSQSVQGVAPSPVITATVPSATIAASPTEEMIVTPIETPLANTPIVKTPIPAVAGKTDVPSVNQSNATPAAVQNNTNDNGNHYGQTPMPERTKDATTNNDQVPNDSGSQTPKDQSKPPK